MNRERRETLVHPSQAIENLLRGDLPSLSGGGVSLVLESVLSPENRILSDPSKHREQELEFLSVVESIIESELRKSGDDYFVELSMKLSKPNESIDARLQRNFALVFGDINNEDPLVSDLVELETTIRTYRSLVLL